MKLCRTYLLCGYRGPSLTQGLNPSDLQHLALPEHINETGEIVLEAMKLQVPLEDLRFTVDDVMERLHEAESKIERLQYRLDQIVKTTKASADGKKKSATTGRKKKGPKLRRGEILLSSILPPDLTSLTAFAELHGVPWSAVTKAIKDYELFPERGNWRDGYRTVKVAIDERGCATFYELFHGHAKFRRCEECPHTWW